MKFNVEMRFNTPEMLAGNEPFGDIWQGIADAFEAETSEEAFELGRDYLLDNLAYDVTFELSDNGFMVFDILDEGLISEVELRVKEVSD